MSYRPITDVWILGRPKVRYHGAYPAGFLARARALLGVSREAAVLHVCAGRVRDYRCGPTCAGALHFHGFGVNDRTLDLDAALHPDFHRDARLPFPDRDNGTSVGTRWDAVLIDGPYTDEDADRYAPGRATRPTANQLLRHGIDAVWVGGRVGVLDYVWPSPPKTATEVAVIAVGTGRNQRARWFTVCERVS